MIFGALSAGLMIPMQFPDKRAALLGAFLNRFGFVIGCVRLQCPEWAVGLLLSLPDAIITKAFAPILVLGATTAETFSRGNRRLSALSKSHE